MSESASQARLEHLESQDRQGLRSWFISNAADHAAKDARIAELEKQLAIAYADIATLRSPAYIADRNKEWRERQ